MITLSALTTRSLTAAEQKNIADTVAQLGQAPMTPTAHGYIGPDETIMSAARRGAVHYGQHSKDSTAIAIMEVILAAHRDYNRQVEPHVRRLRQNYPGLTLKQLAALTGQFIDGAAFKAIWGHSDQQKYQTLKDVLAVFVPQLGDPDTVDNDHRIVSAWAQRSQLATRKHDPIGQVRNIGIATFQHLRMVFGINTVKPDQRVQEVLEREFGLRLSPAKAITVVERMAEVLGVEPLLVDQIFVKYGSGYYLNSSAPPPS